MSDPADASVSELTAEPPLGGMLTDAFDSALRMVIGERLQAGVSEEEIASRLEQLELDGALDQVAARVFASVIEKVADQAEYLAAGERALAGEMREVWGRADGLYQAASYVAYEIGAAIAGPGGQPVSARLGTILGAHGRALRTAGEIRLLAMNGFHTGAQARWRSLHDLAVLCSVLKEVPAEISERYSDYMYVEWYRDLLIYQEHASAIGRAPLTDQELSAALAAFESVKAKWGAEIAKPHGWAFPLFPGKKKVDFSELEELAGLSHLRPFYRLGNNFVHAGPRGFLLNTRVNQETGTREIKVGASVYEDIAETCHGAMLSLHQATASLCTAYLREGEPGSVDVLVGLMVHSRFLDAAGDAWVKAADEARSRGWFTHGSD